MKEQREEHTDQHAAHGPHHLVRDHRQHERRGAERHDAGVRQDVTEGGDQLDDGDEPLERDEDREGHEDRDHERREQGGRQHLERGKERRHREHDHHDRHASAHGLTAVPLAPRIDHGEHQPEADVHDAERHGQRQERENRLFTVESVGDHAEDAMAQIAEELAEDHAEDDRERRARAAHRRHAAERALGLRAQSEHEREDREQRAVADVSHHEPKEHGEEHRDEGRGINGAVARERQRSRDHLEGLEERWVRQGDRRVGPTPWLAPHLLDQHLGPQLARRQRRQARQLRPGDPALEDEEMGTGVRLLACVEDEQLVVEVQG